jgi:hypothetical protein
MRSKGIQHYNLQMCDIIDQADQRDFYAKVGGDEKYKQLIDRYSTTISTLQPSYMKVLWDNDIYNNKFVKEKDKYGLFSDGHPSPEEHLQYIEKTLPFKFSERTRDAVMRCQYKMEKITKKKSKQIGREYFIFEMPYEFQKKLYDSCTLALEVNPDII